MHLSLFLESVNNRCLTRKRIPPVTLSNGGLALFLQHKTKAQQKHKNLHRWSRAHKELSVKMKFLSGGNTSSVWGNVLLNITVKYSVVPTTRYYYINGAWLQKDGGTTELLSDSPAPRLLSKTTQHSRQVTQSVSEETNKNRRAAEREDETEWHQK